MKVEARWKVEGGCALFGRWEGEDGGWEVKQKWEVWDGGGRIHHISYLTYFHLLFLFQFVNVLTLHLEDQRSTLFSRRHYMPLQKGYSC